MLRRGDAIGVQRRGSKSFPRPSRKFVAGAVGAEATFPPPQDWLPKRGSVTSRACSDTSVRGHCDIMSVVGIVKARPDSAGGSRAILKGGHDVLEGTW